MASSPAADRRRGRSLLPVLVLLATGTCARPVSPPDVLLITLDTTRADRLGCYGHAGARTPVLDALARQGVRFDRAYAQVPLTLASHASLLTGTYPAVHGLHVNAGGRLGEGLPTLADVLRAQGYRTGAFVASYVLDGAFGLERGFEVYDDDLQGDAQSARFQVERPANRVVDAALEWLSGDAAGPFFAWVHLYDPHSPYAPPEPYAGRFADPYDGEIAFVDEQLGRLFDWLRSSGRLERTLVVVAGDHGESFGEHGEPEHGLFVYDTTVRVPLIVSWPGRLPANESRDADVQLVDLYPTVVELAGAAAGERHDGASLVETLHAGTASPREVYGETRYGELGYGWARLRFLIHDRWKYIAAPRPELFDRGADAAEAHNLADERPEVVAAMLERLERLERGLVPAGVEEVDLDPAARARLEALGYVDPADAGDGAPAADAPDPKDMLEVFRGHTRAKGLVKAGRWDPAAAQLERLVEASPGSYDLYEDLGFAYLGLGRAADAERAYRRSLTNLPDHAERLWGLGESLRRQSRLDEAIERFERALVQRPDFGEAHLGLTLSYASRDEPAQALRHARRYAEINPASLLAWTNRATMAIRLGEHDEAVEAAGRLLALAPDDPQAHYLHWEALRAAGRREAEVEALRRAHERFPGDWLFGCALAWRLAVTPGSDPGTLDEALRLARQAAATNPRSPRSFDALAAALAAHGRFDEAVEALERAVALLPAGVDEPFRDELDRRLALYRAGRPYRE